MSSTADMNDNEKKTSEEPFIAKSTHISDIIGHWGPMRTQIFIIATIIYIANPLQNLSLALYTPRLDFWCTDPSVPVNNFTVNQCVIGTTQCKAFKYNTSTSMMEYGRTLTTELNMVCDKSLYPSLGQSFHQIGYAVSGVLFGVISDNYGRTFSLRIALLLELVAGFTQAFTTSSTIWLINRILLGACVYGRFLNLYVLLLEWVGTRYRASAVILFESGYSIGKMLLPIIFYYVADYRIMQSSLSSLQIAGFIVVVFCIPESPRWQMTHGKVENARKQIFKELKARKAIYEEEDVNRQINQLHTELQEQIAREKTMKVPSVFDLMRSPKLLKTSCILFYVWMSIAFNSYGSVFNVGLFGKNALVNMFIFGVSHMGSNIFCYFCLGKFGRRKLLITFFALQSLSYIAMLSLSFFPSLDFYMVLAAFFMGFNGNASWNILYLYTGETFPTVLRQQAIGTCSVFARMGSVIAPFMKELIIATHISVAFSIFASLSAIASFVCFFLPEIKGKDIPDSVGQAVANHDSESGLQGKQVD